MPTTPVTDADDLAGLIDDARQLSATIRPRPRVPRPRRIIDLTALEITIPEATISLVEDYADYGC